ncbi:MAG: hypothetical protein KGL64_04570 [Acidobacteriota bacterium]|nr:hypothetical protein [Acidobacteriota bacterium]
MSLLLSAVIADGTYAAIPAAGIDGRIYFATDTKKVYRDSGTAWVDITPGEPAAMLAAAPSAPGNFSLAHGLAVAPSRISILMTSGGAIWQQAAADAANIHLAASDAGITATIYVFA